MKIFLVIVVVFSVLCGCETEESCLVRTDSAIKILLKEAGTQNPISKGRPIGFVQDGNYIDTLRYQILPDTSTAPLFLRAAPHRGGTYSIFIELEGYEPWIQEGVQVAPESECYFEGVFLTAFLKKK